MRTKKDLVRVCKCGARVVFELSNHGHIDILRAEANGYIKVIGMYVQIRQAWNGNMNRYFNEQVQTSFIREHVGESRYLTNMNLKRFNKECRKGTLLRYSRKELDKLNIRQTTVYSLSQIPIKLLTSICPSKVKWVFCSQCDSMLSLHTFKQLSHS